ncbi:MAG: hypothetical protein H7328_03640 [Bdellovibrio sp.]|nr:hypothetical protein [Bdellovibrio sp.]
MQKISSLELFEKPSVIFYKNDRIEFNQQSLKNQLVETSYVKKVYASNELKSAEAVFIEPRSVKVLNAKPATRNEKRFVTKVSHEVAPLYLRNYNSENVLKLHKGVLKDFQALHYELNDGTLWKAYFSGQRLVSIEKQGSQFNEFTAQVYPLGPKHSDLTEVLLKGLQLNTSVSNQYVLVDSESSQKMTSVLPHLKFDPKDERFDQVQVFYYLDYIQTWMRENLSVRFPEKLNAVVDVGYPDKTNTAFYFQNKIRFGRGDDVDYGMLASDPSIVYHESFHALIDGMARLPFEKEGGSLNEGFADFFTCVVLNRPFLGETAYLKGPFKRTIQANIRLSEKTGGLYHDSQILSSLLWEIKEKLGKEKSLKLATDTLSKLNPNSDFNHFNSQIIEVIKLMPAKDQEIVNPILASRGFNYE